MTKIEELEIRASQVEANPQEAVAAMVSLARIYGDGEDGVKPDQLKALEWAEKAAFQDSPDGYLEITRIVGSACVGTKDYGQKTEYAVTVMTICDPTTLCRFGRADIAYNVGSVCEYMAVGVDSTLYPSQDSALYRAAATSYYALALDLTAVYAVSEEMRDKILHAYHRMRPDAASRPAAHAPVLSEAPRFL